MRKICCLAAAAPSVVRTTCCRPTRAVSADARLLTACRATGAVQECWREFWTGTVTPPATPTPNVASAALRCLRRAHKRGGRWSSAARAKTGPTEVCEAQNGAPNGAASLLSADVAAAGSRATGTTRRAPCCTQQCVHCVAAQCPCVRQRHTTHESSKMTTRRHGSLRCLFARGFAGRLVRKLVLRLMATAAAHSAVAGEERRHFYMARDLGMQLHLALAMSEARLLLHASACRRD
jgi:hypothetical protein